MTDLGTKLLETPRLLLRPFTVDDAPAMYASWACDPEVTKFLTWPVHSGPEVTRTLLEEWTSQYQDPTYYNWAIVWKETGALIGNISVPERKESSASCHIGYCLSRAFWHKGVMTEAFSEVIRFLFEEVGALRIGACHDPQNPHSGGVMKKCGLTYEGTRRQWGKNNQGICDEVWYSILRAEYFGRKGERE